MGMLRRFSAIVLGLCLLGQGCITSPVPQQPVTGTQGEPSPDGLVAFAQGFGLLPLKAPTYTAGSHPTVVFGTELPNLPNAVTVLREWSSAPDDALLHNLTDALRIPAGMLGKSPTGESASVRWHDDGNNTWSYDSEKNMVQVERSGAPASAVARTSTNERAIQTARVFIADHGIDTSGWGDPYALPSAVIFPASRDHQSLVGSDGRLIPGALIETDASGQVVERATFELPRSSDRSNYAALTMGQVTERLRAGGTNPVQGSPADTSITLTQFTLALQPFQALIDGRLRTFDVPVLWARGTVRRGDVTAEYATTVPLIRDDQFAH
jgi:hypothetical protein